MVGPSVGSRPLAEIQPYHEDTVRSWLNRYEQGGLTGLRVKEGRGRKPVFSPIHLSIETAAPDLQGRLSRSPRLYGLEQSRLPPASPAETS